MDEFWTACCPDQSLPCFWCKTFGGTRPPINKRINDPYVSIALEAGAKDNLVRFFMRTDEEDPGFSEMAEQVEAF